MPCSRWSELCDALRFHANLAHASGAMTEFRLLNGAAPLLIGTGDREVKDLFLSLLDTSPDGGTPLCWHINAIVAAVGPIAGQLRAAGQRAVLTIFTDGESSDGDVAQSLRPLNGLPVTVVIRLCTDDERVVHYWNAIDKVSLRRPHPINAVTNTPTSQLTHPLNITIHPQQLEITLDVVDDLIGEADEVRVHNKWLNYAEPLHRLREFGCHGIPRYIHTHLYNIYPIDSCTPSIPMFPSIDYDASKYTSLFLHPFYSNSPPLPPLIIVYPSDSVAVHVVLFSERDRFAG